MSLGKAGQKLRGCSKSPDNDFVPDKKRSRHSNPMKLNQCFATVLNEDVAKKNTQKCTMWAVRVLMLSVEEQNKRNDEKCPIEVLSTSNMAEVRYWICVFVKEARHDDGQPHTPCSLTQLLSGNSTSSIQKGSLLSCW